MKAVVQRVLEASVSVDGAKVSQIGQGLLVLVAAHRDDGPLQISRMAEKIATLRIFEDAEGKMNLDLAAFEPKREVLVVPNFTVYGDTSGNRRPSFTASAPYADGEVKFNQLIEALQQLEVPMQTGIFGADMKVSLTNDGPVTVILETS